MIANFRMIVCRECGEQIFFIRTQSGAKMPVNKDTRLDILLAEKNVL